MSRLDARLVQLRKEIDKRLDGFDPGAWFNLQTEINLCIEMGWPDEEAKADLEVLCKDKRPKVINAAYAYFFLMQGDYDAVVAAYRCLLGDGESEMQAYRGSKKKGSIGPLKQTLERIGSYDALRGMMDNEDDLADFNESDPPHPCKLTDISDGRLGYIVRKTGKSKSTSLSRITDIFNYELK